MTLLDELCAFGPLKVWSVLVTIFGDLSYEEGSEVSGGQLSEICGAVGIRPEALRVALHRLRKDNWIDSRREGRQSWYRLTTKGRAETSRVREHVYAPRLARPESLWILLFPGEVPAGLLRVAPRTALAETPRAEAFSAQVEGAKAPDWLRDVLLNQDLTAELRRFSALLGTGCNAPLVVSANKAALRIMILHVWRRLILRVDPFAAHVLAEDALLSECRARVVACLEALSTERVE